MKKAFVVVFVIEVIMALLTGFVVLPSIDPLGIQLTSPFNVSLVVWSGVVILGVLCFVLDKKPNG